MALTTGSSEDSWCTFLKHFADSVQHVTGQIIDVRPASDMDHSLLQDEMEQLRATVDKLSAEVSPWMMQSVPEL